MLCILDAARGILHSGLCKQVSIDDALGSVLDLLGSILAPVGSILDPANAVLYCS